MTLNYIEKTAKLIQEEILPEGRPTSKADELYTLYAMLALTKGEETTLEDVHDAWAVWKILTHSAHADLVPFNELDENIQDLDRPYMDVIHRVARLV